MRRNRFQRQYEFFLALLGGVALASGCGKSASSSGSGAGAAATLLSYGATSGWTFVPIDWTGRGQ